MYQRILRPKLIEVYFSMGVATLCRRWVCRPRRRLSVGAVMLTSLELGEMVTDRV